MKKVDFSKYNNKQLRDLAENATLELWDREYNDKNSGWRLLDKRSDEYKKGFMAATELNKMNNRRYDDEEMF